MLGKGEQGGPSREQIVCLRYELTFDDDRVLRHWKREWCQLKKPTNQLIG